MGLVRTLTAGVALCAALVGCSWIIGTSGDVELRGPDGTETDGGELDALFIGDAPMHDDAAGDAGTSDAAVNADADADAAGEATVVDAAAPIAYVQGTAVDLGAKSSGTVSFANDVEAHSAIVVAFDVNGIPNFGSITDTRGNTYQLVLGPHDNGGVRTFLAVALDSSPGPCAVTVTLDAAALSSFDVYVHEYAGIAASQAVDAVHVADGTQTGTDGMRSGAVTTSSSNELIFGFGIAGQAKAGTGFTSRSELNGNVTEDKIVATAGSYEATETMTSGATWSMLVLALHGK